MQTNDFLVLKLYYTLKIIKIIFRIFLLTFCHSHCQKQSSVASSSSNFFDNIFMLLQHFAQLCLFFFLKADWFQKAAASIGQLCREAMFTFIAVTT